MEEIKSLVVIEKSVKDILETVRNLTVHDNESKLEAENILSIVRPKVRDIDFECKLITTPMEAEKKWVIGLFRKAAAPLVEIDCKLTIQLEEYRQKEEARIRKEEEKLLAKQEKLNLKNPSPLPVIVAPSVAQLDKSSGGVTYIKKYKAYIVDESLVPILFTDVFLRPIDMVAVNRLVAAGIKSIPGIEIREESELRVR